MTGVSLNQYELEEEQNLERYKISIYFHQYIFQPARDNVPELESETKVQDERLADSLGNGVNFGDRIHFANEHYSATPDKKTGDIIGKGAKRKMEELFENLDVSEACLEDILERVFESLNDVRKEKLLGSLKTAKDGKTMSRIIKVVGKLQKRINKENEVKKEPQPSGITFTEKILK